MSDMSLFAFDASSSAPWQGTFHEYLDQVEATPDIANSAHQRLYRMILSHGMATDTGTYPFFSSVLFGMDETLTQLVQDYLKPAALGYDVKKRILLLVGPVSGGKSSLVARLKQGLEDFSRTDAGALYGIKGCPMHEEPLHLIPNALRDTAMRRLGVRIEGDLCPWCRYHLEHEFQGRFHDVPVERVMLSEQRRIGIGTYAPSDPKSQDISELTGSVDFHQISQYGSESDPRAFRFDGELNIANRGLMEFQEMLKLDEKFLYHLLSLSQEGNFKTGRYELISADEVIIGHTNEHEYRAFIQNPRNEALKSRLFIVPVPYNLDYQAEVKIYQKLVGSFKDPAHHMAPYTLESAAALSIASRIKEVAKPGGDRQGKFKAYVTGADPDKVRQLQHEGRLEGEGFDGLDPRFMMNRLAQVFSSTRHECVDAIDVLHSIEEGMNQDPFIERGYRERVAEWINMAREWYERQVEVEVLEAFANDWGDELTNLYHNYVDNVTMAVTSMHNRSVDERLMRSVEERMGISEIQAAGFREEIYSRLDMARKQHRPMNFLEHSALHRALKAKLLDDMRDEVKITTASPVPDRRVLEKIERASERLVATGRYCPHCAAQTIRYVGSLLNR